jgi:prevent-host-death family protein
MSVMPRIDLQEDVKPLSEFRSSVTACLGHVRKTGRPLVITQHGKPAAVLLDVSAHEDLLARIEVLQDIRTAERQLDEGLGIPHRRALAEAIRRVQG